VNGKQHNKLTDTATVTRDSSMYSMSSQASGPTIKYSISIWILLADEEEVVPKNKIFYCPMKMEYLFLDENPTVM